MFKALAYGDPSTEETERVKMMIDTLFTVNTPF